MVHTGDKVIFSRESLVFVRNSVKRMLLFNKTTYWKQIIHGARKYIIAEELIIVNPCTYTMNIWAHISNIKAIRKLAVGTSQKPSIVSIDFDASVNEYMYFNSPISKSSSEYLA